MAISLRAPAKPNQETRMSEPAVLDRRQWVLDGLPSRSHGFRGDTSLHSVQSVLIEMLCYAPSQGKNTSGFQAGLVLVPICDVCLGRFSEVSLYIECLGSD
jgi:hypothetical protein